MHSTRACAQTLKVQQLPHFSLRPFVFQLSASVHQFLFLSVCGFQALPAHHRLNPAVPQRLGFRASFLFADAFVFPEGADRSDSSMLAVRHKPRSVAEGTMCCAKKRSAVNMGSEELCV